MTAYSLTPVGRDGVEPERGQVVVIPSRAELLEENRRLRLRLAALEYAAERSRYWFAEWEAQANLRIAVQNRLAVAARVLHEIERLYPHTGTLIDRAREEIWP